MRLTNTNPPKANGRTKQFVSTPTMVCLTACISNVSENVRYTDIFRTKLAFCEEIKSEYSNLP